MLSVLGALFPAQEPISWYTRCSVLKWVWGSQDICLWSLLSRVSDEYLTVTVTVCHLSLILRGAETCIVPFDIASCWGRGKGFPFPSSVAYLFFYLFIWDESLLPQEFSPSEIIAWLSMDPFVAVVICPLLLLARLYFNKPLPVISLGKCLQVLQS